MLSLFLLSLLPTPTTNTVDVDVLELNHIFSARVETDGYTRPAVTVNHCGSYWVMWKWYEETLDIPAGYHVRDWASQGANDTLSQRDGRYTLTVRGKKQTVHIRGKAFRESFTLYDSEREDEKELPLNRREVIEGLRK